MINIEELPRVLLNNIKGFLLQPEFSGSGGTMGYDIIKTGIISELLIEFPYTDQWNDTFYIATDENAKNIVYFWDSHSDRWNFNKDAKLL